MTKYWRRLNRFLNHHELAIILLLIVVLLRLPSLFEPYWYGDETIYLAIGQAIRHGQVLYQGITDYPNKPPLIYLLAAVTQTVFNFRLLLLFWTLATTIVFYEFSQLLTKNRLISIAASLVFIFFTSTPIIEGNIANAEIFFILPTLLSAGLLYLASHKPKTSRYLFFLSGCLLGISFLFKIHVLLDIAALGWYFFILSRLKTISIKSLRLLIISPDLWLFIAGLAAPVIIAIAWLSLSGVSPLSLLQNATGSSSYVGVWTQKDWLLMTLGMGDLRARFVLVALIMAVVFFFRRRFHPQLLLFTTWTLLALFAALLSARPYPHYLIQLVPPAILGLAVFASTSKAVLSKISFGLVIALIFAAYLRFGFHTWSVSSYYTNFYQYITGHINRDEFYARFDNRMPRNYQLATYLRTVTNPPDHIYIWGTEADVYILSHRLQEGNLVVSFHVADLNDYHHTAEIIKQNHTPIIVVMETEPRDFPELEGLLASDYLLLTKIGDPRRSPSENQGHYALVYKRI